MNPISGVLSKSIFLTLCIFALSGLAACGGLSGNESQGWIEDFSTTDVGVIRYHVRQYHNSLQEFVTQLYAKNPKYEKDSLQQQRKIDSIFASHSAVEEAYSHKQSHEILTAAFQPETVEPDRVYLLGLGLWKSIVEAYDAREEKIFVSGLQIPLERLQRLHHNFSQVNWRLKTYKDQNGKLFFITNEAGKDGYLNMGYEVIMTQILTRLEDDIAMRGGLPEKYMFSMSTFFVGILL